MTPSPISTPNSSLSEMPAAEFRALLERAASPQRRAALMIERQRTDVALFARHVLGGYLRLRFAPFHHRLFDWHRVAGAVPLPDRTGHRLAVAAPRGSAKSTIVSFMLTLHDIVYARERYILLVSATQRQAQQRLRALRNELAGDTALVGLHPRAALERRRRSAPGNKVAPAASNAASVLVANGVRVEAFGGGQEMRGISHDGWRPTKIILDDAESSASAASPRARQKLHDWFGEVVEHLGDRYTHLLAIGTILHPAALLPTLMARPDFESLLCRSIEEFAAPSPLWEEWRALLTDATRPHRREEARAFFERHRQAMEAGTRVLWPEHEDYEHLQAQIITQGRRAFFQEKQNAPLGPEDALFDGERCWRLRGEGEGWTRVPPAIGDGAASSGRYDSRALRYFAFLDSALGKRRADGTGDFAALATVGVASDGTLALVDLWAKRAPPSAQIEAVFQRHDLFGYERVAFEGTGFQELIADPFHRLGAERTREGLRPPPPLEIVKPTRRKEARIATLEPLLATGRLALAEGLPEEFWDELARYPRVQHDDALDAAAGAVELALAWSAKGTARDEILRQEREPDRGPRRF